MSAPPLAPRMSRFPPVAQPARDDARARESTGLRAATIVSLTAGEPDFPTPRHVKQAVLDAMEVNNTRKYTPINGTIPGNAPGGQRPSSCAENNDLHYGLDQITVGGRHQADPVQLPDGQRQLGRRRGHRAGPLLDQLSGHRQDRRRHAGRRLLRARTRRFKMRPEQLDEAINAGYQMAGPLVSPNNPSGATYTADELRAFAAEMLKPSIRTCGC